MQSGEIRGGLGKFDLMMDAAHDDLVMIDEDDLGTETAVSESHLGVGKQTGEIRGGLLKFDLH